MTPTARIATDSPDKQAIKLPGHVRPTETKFLDERHHDSRTPRGRFKFADWYELADVMGLGRVVECE